MPDAAKTPVLRMAGICMAYERPGGAPLTVLHGVDIELRAGEILGLLGRSGSGKSTLLRIAGGLVRPTAGRVEYRGRALAGPAAGIAMVFQTFALYPWLTVQENVEFGLDSLDLPPQEGHARAAAAIDLIGLDGFESAYPRELSGGMRQRVGFARAIVSDPTLLLMDEPFSALDVLTAETLRTDFIDLWTGGRLPTQAVFIVTHNIEEAVQLCDRILVLGANPGHIVAEVAVPLAQPRDRFDARFRQIVDAIYAVQTSRIAAAIDSHGGAHGGLAQVLPDVPASDLGTFAEALAAPAFGGRAELARIAAPLGLSANRVLQLAAALHLLEFGELQEGALKLSAAGRLFAAGGAEERKRLFREHLLRFVPLAARVKEVLEEREAHRAPRRRFELELEDHMHRADVERTLRAIIGWGRYAELFAYDDRNKSFRIESGRDPRAPAGAA